MIWALLAAYLTKRPPAVQAVVFGVCAGLFVAAVANSDVRNPVISSVVLLVLVVGVLAGGAFFLSLRARSSYEAAPPVWVQIAYTAVWVLSIGAAVRALLAAGGFKVAVLAIVPIVLLAPPAIHGIGALLHRGSHADGEPTAEPTPQV
jgi:cytochrome bd-type quinol oxidase subunit 2